MTSVKLFSIVSIIVLLLASCGSPPKNDGDHERAFLDSSPEGYLNLGISESEAATWEDGMRTDGKEGSYEWWYTDAEFSDGTTIVLIFFTKHRFDVPGPAHPTVHIDITFADGRNIVKMIQEPQGSILNASRDSADVRIDDSYIRYIDGNYQVYFTDGDIEYKALMESTLPMWRPDTGHWYFGDDKKNFFAWFVAQPAAKITGSLTVGGETTALSGTGYHDHNWGNIAMNEVMNHWYWGRTKVGEYNIIAVDIVSEEDTGFTRLPVFMIARNGVILDDDQSRTIVVRENTEQHPETGKFYDNHLTYIQNSADGTAYTVEMIRHQDIVAVSLLNKLPAYKRWLARLIGANPTYVRSLGEVILTVEKDGEKETLNQEGLWEQMFFGNNKDAYIWN